jgi:hypothetical protein
MGARTNQLAQTQLVDDDEESRSGVRPMDRIERETAERGALRVMLTITKWENATPGVLVWEFESISAAHKAARTFRNALAWAIFPANYPSFEAAKRAGDVILTSDEAL